MDLSVIIVNWNTKDLLLDCIASVYNTITGPTFEIFVVDNHSADGSVDEVRKRFPTVICIENDRNMGFAKANNQALRRMNGRYAALLNSDTVLTRGAVETIVRFMDINIDVGMCGGQLLNADNSKQNSVANIPTLTTELLNKSLLRRLFPEKYPGKEHNFAGPVEVESIIGACMVVRKTAFEDAGLMDESYFFFLEETDWCLRMKKRGWKVFHHPGAAIYHLQGQSAGKVDMRARIEYWRSRYLFFRKNYTGKTVKALMAGLLIKLVFSAVLSLMQNFVVLFARRRARHRLRLYLRLIGWHLNGCPPHYGLSTAERLEG